MISYRLKVPTASARQVLCIFVFRLPGAAPTFRFLAMVMRLPPTTIEPRERTQQRARQWTVRDTGM